MLETGKDMVRGKVAKFYRRLYGGAQLCGPPIKRTPSVKWTLGLVPKLASS